MAQKVKDEYDLDFFIETSAKNGINTKELFVKAAKVLYDDYNEYNKKEKKKEKDKDKGENIDSKSLAETIKKKKNKCC